MSNLGFLSRSRALLGMVHLGALPGTPRAHESVETIASRAADEARLLISHGFAGVVIENMHDAPYLSRRVGPEIVSAMTVAGLAVRGAADDAARKAGAPAPILGVQVLAGDNAAALAVALACGAAFVRAEGYVFASVADEGLLAEADAGPLLRYRRAIGAGHIGVAADIKKKHSAHALTADVDIAETARAAEFFEADAVIVTGAATGLAVDLAELSRVRSAASLPVIVGSGATPDSLAGLFAHADAVIAGSWFKRDGHWKNPPDAARVRAMSDAARRCVT